MQAAGAGLRALGLREMLRPLTRLKPAGFLSPEQAPAWKTSQKSLETGAQTGASFLTSQRREMKTNSYRRY